MRDKDLDDLFAEARDKAPLPSADLMARILADAEAAQPRPPAWPARPSPARSGPARPSSAHPSSARPSSAHPGPGRPWRMRRAWALAIFGGGGVFAGLVTATVAGVWIGVRQPAPVAAALWRSTAAEQQLESLDLAPGFDLFASLDVPVEG